MSVNVSNRFYKHVSTVSIIIKQLFSNELEWVSFFFCSSNRVEDTIIRSTLILYRVVKIWLCTRPACMYWVVRCANSSFLMLGGAVARVKSYPRYM